MLPLCSAFCTHARLCPHPRELTPLMLWSHLTSVMSQLMVAMAMISNMQTTSTAPKTWWLGFWKHKCQYTTYVIQFFYIYKLETKVTTQIFYSLQLFCHFPGWKHGHGYIACDTRYRFNELLCSHMNTHTRSHTHTYPHEAVRQNLCHADKESHHPVSESFCFWPEETM